MSCCQRIGQYGRETDDELGKARQRAKMLAKPGVDGGGLATQKTG